MKPELKSCFFVTPIGSEKSKERANADALFEQIEFCFSKDYPEFQLIRADLEFHNTENIKRIQECIEQADLIIADLSGHNPNVYYELGYARAFRKEIIQIRNHDTENLPFDIAGYNTPKYDLSSMDSKKDFREQLSKIIQNINFDKTTKHLGGGIFFEKVGEIKD